jgi:glycerol uptake facilitator-like aquaporin
VLLGTAVASAALSRTVAPGNVVVSLLAQTLAAGAVLIALTSSFSGGYFNPAITVAHAGTVPWKKVPLYVIVQLGGAIAGALAVHLIFAERLTPQQIGNELLATFGLLSVIWGVVRRRADAVLIALSACILVAIGAHALR